MPDAFTESPTKIQACALLDTQGAWVYIATVHGAILQASCPVFLPATHLLLPLSCELHNTEDCLFHAYIL